MKSIIDITLLLYVSSSITYFIGLKRNNSEKLSVTLAALGLLFNLLLLAIRTKITGGLPLRNGYDFLLTFAFLTVLTYLIYLRYMDNYSVKRAGGPIMMIASLLFFAVYLFSPSQSSISTPLAPALKSPWLTIHVLTAAIAYSGFALAAALAMVYIRNSHQPSNQSVYRVVTFSFALLSFSIIFGAIWAEQAWGSYWSWDPKETWALITWLIYAAYLHVNRKQNWRGKPANLLAIAGFIIVLFTFFGVNYLFSGLHSYS